MKEGGSIICTTSVVAYKGIDSLLDYCATKGAIVAFIRGLALQLVKRGIRVNGVAPGPIWTPLIPASFDEEEVQRFGNEVPMQRAGQPYEVGPTYVFLASETFSSYYTGQVFHPNGKYLTYICDVHPCLHTCFVAYLFDKLGDFFNLIRRWRYSQCLKGSVKECFVF